MVKATDCVVGAEIWRATILALVVIGAPAVAGAQAPPPPPELEGTAEFAFVGSTGNSSTQTIGVGGEFIYRPAPWEARVKTAYVRNESGDQLRAHSFVVTTRAQRMIGTGLSAYGQYGYQRDRFAGILARNTIEAGLVYTWINEARHTLIVDGGYGYAKERRLTSNNLSTAVVGTGGSYTLRLSATSTLSEDGRFVFSVRDGDDWRYVNTSALTATVTTLLSLKLSNMVRYVHRPALGFEATDIVTSVALVANF